MYRELAKHLYLAPNTSKELAIVATDGHNAACVFTMVFTTATVTVTVTSLSGEDGVKWSSADSVQTLATGPSYSTSSHLLAKHAYVRVAVATNAIAAIVSVGIDCTKAGPSSGKQTPVKP